MKLQSAWEMVDNERQKRRRRRDDPTREWENGAARSPRLLGDIIVSLRARRNERLRRNRRGDGIMKEIVDRTLICSGNSVRERF